MTQRLEMYRCEICGNLVQVIIEGEGELFCCGKPMQLLHAKGKDAEGLEKHVPVFELKSDNGYEVLVGSEPHPMLPEHYIMFIETISQDKNYVHLKYLHPGEQAKMLLDRNYGKTLALEFCNIHGLWEGESD